MHKLAWVAAFMVMAGSAQAQVGWAVGQGDAIPRGALAGGQEAAGQVLYPCVAMFNGGMHPGKVRPGFNGCNVPWGGGEHRVGSYRVPTGGVWRGASGGQIPVNAVPAGFEANGTPLYVCRGAFQGGMHPGKIRAGFGGCNIGYGGAEHVVRSYDVLTEW